MARKQMMTFCRSKDSSSVRPRGGRRGNRGVSWYTAPQILITDDMMHRTLYEMLTLWYSYGCG